RKEEIERARFDVATRRATLERLRRDAAKAELRAPFTGFVIAKRTEVGEWVVIGGPVCEMVAMEKVKVRVDVPESAIPFALPPRPASVTIEALRETREGAIARLIPRATQAARTFPIEIDLPNED